MSDNWFAQQVNPHDKDFFKSFGTAMAGMQWDVSSWARQQFASSYARGGFTATAFAPSRKEALKSILRRPVKSGSQEHIRRLEKIQQLHPENKGVEKALGKARAAKITKGGVASKAFGPALGIGFAAHTMISTEGGVAEKAEAGIGFAAGTLGWIPGAKIGAGVGAAVGTFAGPLGTIVGAGVGALAGGMLGWTGAEEGVKFAASVPRRLVEREREKRQMGWGTPNAAFYTRQAATMRQVSLQAMNRGMTTARSAMGREAMFLHK